MTADKEKEREPVCYKRIAAYMRTGEDKLERRYNSRNEGRLCKRVQLQARGWGLGLSLGL